MTMNDPRAKQALYMAKSPRKSSGGVVTAAGRGRAIVFIALTAAALAGAIWLFFSMLR